MKTKLIFYVSISTITLVVKVFWLSFLVCGITFIDICFGVFLVWKLKQEAFSWSRLFEGFLKMIAYVFFIGFSYVLSENIFDGKLFEIQHFTPKILTMIFLILEATSIDNKSQKLGKKPILEVVRGAIKIFKELHKSTTTLDKNKDL